MAFFQIPARKKREVWMETPNSTPALNWLPVGCDSQNGSSNAWHRSFFDFDLSSLDGRRIKDAYIMLSCAYIWGVNWGSGTTNELDWEIGNVTGTWSESTITWNSQPTMGDWVSVGWDSTKTVNVWKAYPVGPLIQYLLDNPSIPRNGFRMRQVSGTGGTVRYFSPAAFLQGNTRGFGYINVGGTWREADAYVKAGGVWKEADGYVKAGGVWKPAE